MFPSGEQVEISRGDQRAVAVTVGGGLREYVAAGEAILDGYGAGEMCDGARGQLLVPWPNRLRDGAYGWEGRRLQLPLTEPERGNAIHGLARWVAWRVVEHEASAAVLGLDLPPQPGYPFQLQLRVAYELTADGLAVRQSATNLGSIACPYGAGAHPYLAAGAGTVDAANLEVPAGTCLVVDSRQIPIGAQPVDGTAADFRRARPIGAVELDTAYTDLERDASGVVRFRFAVPGRPLISLWAGSSVAYVMVFTGDTLDPARRRRGLAVEPMTCAPNAFQSGDGLRVLRPGETAVCEWGITVDPAG